MRNVHGGERGRTTERDGGDGPGAPPRGRKNGGSERGGSADAHLCRHGTRKSGALGGIRLRAAALCGRVSLTIDSVRLGVQPAFSQRVFIPPRSTVDMSRAH